MIMMKNLTQTAATLALIACLPAPVMAEDFLKELRNEVAQNFIPEASVVLENILSAIEEVESENGYEPLSRESGAPPTSSMSEEEAYLSLTPTRKMPQGVERDTSIDYVPEHLCPSDPADPTVSQSWTSLADPIRQTARLYSVLQNRNVLRTGDCSCTGHSMPWAMGEDLFKKVSPTNPDKFEGIIIKLEVAFGQTVKQFCGAR